MSQDLDTNYFVCTLGQATVVNQGKNIIDNINDFIDHQGQEIPNLPAVGFPIPAKDASAAWTHQLYTFQDLWKGSAHVSEVLKPLVKSTGGSERETVALLCPSTSNFLFTWLGLIRLGHAVLLIAPQCQPAAIAHLCKTCNVKTIFYDAFYEKLALDAVEVIKSDCVSDFEGLLLPIDTTSPRFQEALKKPSEDIAKSVKAKGSTVGYLHHTSGTSTGLPKPIPQTHYAGLGVLPRFSNGSDKATFTTTPLYHGGVADSFRAWAANAMIWLFPGKGVPITAKNIVSCLDVAEREHKTNSTPAVKYFASVPYVLQMMAADTKGLQNLQSMDIVGVGGAALPAEVGDGLVANGVNLISRFGSAECGFLMTSHRDYSEDKEWQYLRSDPQLQVMSFERKEDGNSELVVLSNWPHRVSTIEKGKSSIKLILWTGEDKQRQRLLCNSGPLRTASIHTQRLALPLPLRLATHPDHRQEIRPGPSGIRNRDFAPLRRRPHLRQRPTLPRRTPLPFIRRREHFPERPDNGTCAND